VGNVDAPINISIFYLGVPFSRKICWFIIPIKLNVTFALSPEVKILSPWRKIFYFRAGFPLQSLLKKQRISATTPNAGSDFSSNLVQTFLTIQCINFALFTL